MIQRNCWSIKPLVVLDSALKLFFNFPIFLALNLPNCIKCLLILNSKPIHNRAILQKVHYVFQKEEGGEDVSVSLFVFASFRCKIKSIAVSYESINVTYIIWKFLQDAIRVNVIDLGFIFFGFIVQ